MSIKIQGNANFQGRTILGTATPTYTVGRSLSAVNEGSSVTFTLSTTNVANGTVLPYTISGISSNDVTTGSLTGSFTINSGLATTTITMSADQLTEGAETATLTLNNAAASNFVVVNDTSVFTPNLISGLQLWLDASDSSTLFDATAGGSLVTTDGSAVARWNDKSGNNRHIIQGTANARPLLRTFIKNGKNVLRFDGSNDALAIASPFANTSNASFAFIAFKHNSTTQTGTSGADRILNISFNGTNNRCYAGSGSAFTDSKIGAALGRAGTDNINTTRAIDLNSLLLAFGRNNNSAGQVLINSASAGTLTPVNGGSATTQFIQVGGAFNGYLNGDVYEVLMYSAPLTTLQRQSVESYLNNKWNLY